MNLKLFRIFSIFIASAAFAAAQAPAPVYRADFNQSTLADAGWSVLPAGAFAQAEARLGLVPVNPDDATGQTGRGAVINAAPGQGALIYGPAINVGDDPVVLRLSALAGASGAVVAMGVFDVPPGGSIFDADNTGFFLFENDSRAFLDQWQRMTAMHQPRRGALVPLIQLAVNDVAGAVPALGMFDDFEIVPLNESTVGDPGLRSLFGIGASTAPTPTPTLPGPTPVPPTPTPIEVPDFELEWLLDVSPIDDSAQASSPDVSWDGADRFAFVASDNELGFQDILLRTFEADAGLISEPVTVNETFQDTRANDPSIEIDAQGARLAAWSDNRRLDKQDGVFLTAVAPGGGRLFDEDIWVNEAFEDTDAVMPAFDLSPQGEAVVVWRDDRFFDNSIFARRFDWDGDALTSSDDIDILVNLPFEDTQADSPDVALGDDGRIVAVWHDDRIRVNERPRNDIYARFFKMKTEVNADGALPEANKEVRVSLDDDVFDQATDPSIAFSAGYFLVVWVNENPDTRQRNIHGAVLEDNADIRMSEFVIDLGEETARATAPSVTVWDDGVFYITWFDEATGEVFGEFYDAIQNAYLSDPIVLLNGVEGVERSAAAAGGRRAMSAFDNLLGGLMDVSALSVLVNAPELQPLSLRLVERPESPEYQPFSISKTIQPQTLLIEKAAKANRETKPRRAANATRKTFSTNRVKAMN